MKYWILIFIKIYFLVSIVLYSNENNENKSNNTAPILDRNIDYSPVGKRDPFKSFVLELKKARDASMANPLQKYELSQLKLIGIISNIPVPKAMVEDPTGKGWIVKVGTNIGKHFGKVKKITSDSIVVVEEYHDRFGKLTINEVEVTMDSFKVKSLPEGNT